MAIYQTGIAAVSDKQYWSCKTVTLYSHHLSVKNILTLHILVISCVI